MAELGDALGIDWRPVQERPDGDRTLLVSFSQQAPYIELIQGNPTGVWATENGPRLDHLAYWTDAYADDCAHLNGNGYDREAGGQSTWGGNWSYFRLPDSGVRVELCDTAGRDAFFRRWDLSG